MTLTGMEERPMILTTGIDVGSSAVKVAVLASPAGSGRAREGARLLALHCERIRRRDQRQVIGQAYEEALAKAQVTPAEVDYAATTGEGELVEFRTGHFYGMTAHARGALWLEPQARAVLDLGALHARAIRMDPQARVLGYRMTSQCASGSGQFLENVARYLGVTLDEVGPLSTQAKAPEQVSSICAVLAETDVINMVSRGISLPDILKGIHDSMAGRFAKLLRLLEVKDGLVLVTGGLAADSGMVASLAEALGKARLAGVEVRAHPSSVFAGALGAALWGAYRAERMRGRSASPQTAGLAAAAV